MIIGKKKIRKEQRKSPLRETSLNIIKNVMLKFNNKTNLFRVKNKIVMFRINIIRIKK